MSIPNPRGRQYRLNSLRMLATNDLCHLCGHHGARTSDHIISIKEWLTRHGTLDGVNDPANLAPAHGTKGRALNPCPHPACQGRLCNQVRGSRSLAPQPRSRNW